MPYQQWSNDDIDNTMLFETSGNEGDEPEAPSDPAPPPFKVGPSVPARRGEPVPLPELPGPQEARWHYQVFDDR